MLKSDLWDFSDAYNAVKGDVTLKKQTEDDLLTQETGF